MVFVLHNRHLFTKTLQDINLISQTFGQNVYENAVWYNPTYKNLLIFLR